MDKTIKRSIYEIGTGPVDARTTSSARTQIEGGSPGSVPLLASERIPMDSLLAG
jgi:hypothetical protein